MIVLRRPTTSSPAISANVVVADTLGGLQDGSNFTYTTSYEYRANRIHVSYNGQMLSSPDDFIESDTGEVQLRWIRPASEDVVRATYETNVVTYTPSVVGEKQDLDLVYFDVDTWQTTTAGFVSVPQDLEIFYNGVKQNDAPAGYVATISGGKLTVDFVDPTDPTDWVNAVFNSPTVSGVGGGGNADLLSGKESVVLDTNSQTVSFGQTLDDVDYNLTVVLVTTDINPSVYGYVVNDKTTTGFNVEFSGEIDTSNYTLEWMITAY